MVSRSLKKDLKHIFRAEKRFHHGMPFPSSKPEVGGAVRSGLSRIVRLSIGILAVT